MVGLPADLLSLLYLAVAAYTLWQLPGRWRSLTDDTYTDDDRNLAGRIGFLLLTPLGVLVHELAHMVAAGALGGQNIELHFRAYWGYVQYTGNLGPTFTWIVAAAGPGASLALGLAVGYGMVRLRQPWRDIGMASAHATLLLVLLLYPAMSLIDGIGDFRVIYSERTPNLAILAGAVHICGLIAYIALARMQSRQNRREARHALTERFAGQQVTLRREVMDRLTLLEAAARVRRLEPEERQELSALQELNSWLQEWLPGESAPTAPNPPRDASSSSPADRPVPDVPTPDGPAPVPPTSHPPTPRSPASGPRPSFRDPMLPGFPPPPADDRRN
jgi:hypothetical protein